jgi:hypothetical protein
MRFLVWLTFAGVLPVIASKGRREDDSKDAGQFFNPPDSLGSTHNYSTNLVYTIGKPQTIKFTTVYSHYSINLWQQNIGEDSATQGPSIFSMFLEATR